MANQRQEIYFTGRVQGVGFRHTAKMTSRAFEVFGTVQNLPDGRVKMVVEGESGVIEQFILAVSESTYGNVSETHITQSQATGEFSSFDVIR